jgi:1,2-diacylglycerol 3-beta-galactosyltransferase
MRDIAERLNRSKLELQLILIGGKNEELAAKLRALEWRIPHFIEGFTTKVNYYMQLSDFFIGKPGPGSVSEALAMHLPVIVECNAWTLPQERYNTVYVQEKEVGVVLHHFTEIEGAVAKLIEPAALARYRANTMKLKNRAVFEVPGILSTILQNSRVAVAH